MSVSHSIHARGQGFLSIDDTVAIKLPCKTIVEEMDLEWMGQEGHFFDRNGVLVAVDPSVHEQGPSTLLVERDHFIDYLRSHDYVLLWTLLGEKQQVGGGGASDTFEGRLEIDGAYRVSCPDRLGPHATYLKVLRSGVAARD